MKNFKSVVVAVVVGSLLCSGGLALAQSSSSATITLNNSTSDSGLALISPSGSALVNQGGTDKCDVGASCTYTSISPGIYSVEGIGMAGVLDSLVKTSVEVNGDGSINCNSSGGGGDLLCLFVATTNATTN